MDSQRQAPAALTPGKGTRTHCTGGWVATKAGQLVAKMGRA